LRSRKPPPKPRARELEAKYVEAAKAAWPKIASAIPAEEISDPSSLKKGQMVKVTNWQNRMGWDYAGSSYGWGVTINGTPVVGVYAPHVQSAVNEMGEKLKSDFLSDERMDVIGEVVGPGKCERRVKTEYTDASGSRIGQGERWDPVECLVIKIVALRGGALAVGPNGASSAAASAEKGSLSAVAGLGGAGSASSGGASGMMWRLLTLAIGLVAAATALLKAGYAPVVASPQGAQIRAKLGDEKLAYIGLACAVLGVIWLLKGMIIYGMLVSVAILAAGAYASLDLLESRGIVNAHIASLIRPMGKMIGLACAAVAVLHLLLGGRLIIL
jgi:hypothetical protein